MSFDEIREKEDAILRDLLENSPGFLDYEDTTIIGWDENLKPFSAKDLKNNEGLKTRKMEDIK